MHGTYCIIDLEPNMNFTFGILKFSWLICRVTGQNEIITINTTDFYVKQDDKNFKNHNYKYHGISNKLLKLEGEPLENILLSFSNDLKNYKVNYLCGYNFQDDLNFIYTISDKFDFLSLKKDYIEKKYIILDIQNYVCNWRKLNNITMNTDFQSVYQYLFRSKFPKHKHHNTTLECQYSKNILFKIMMECPNAFEDLEPLIEEKIDFQKVDELKDILEKQILEENEFLKSQLKQIEKYLLQIEFNNEKYQEKIQEQEDIILNNQKTYLELRDSNVKLITQNENLTKQLETLNTNFNNINENKIKLQCKNEELSNQVKTLTDNYNNLNKKYDKHQEISKNVLEMYKKK